MVPSRSEIQTSATANRLREIRLMASLARPPSPICGYGRGRKKQRAHDRLTAVRPAHRSRSVRPLAATDLAAARAGDRGFEKSRPRPQHARPGRRCGRGRRCLKKTILPERSQRGQQFASDDRFGPYRCGTPRDDGGSRRRARSAARTQQAGRKSARLAFLDG